MRIHWGIWIFLGLVLGGVAFIFLLLWFIKAPLRAQTNQTQQPPPLTAAPGPTPPNEYNVDLMDGGERISFRTRAATLAEAIRAQGIPLQVEDRLTPVGSTALSGPLHGEIKRAIPIQVVTREGSYNIRTAAATVGDALAGAGFAPQSMDYTQPSLEDALPEDGKIRLVRVAERVRLDQKMLPYETEYKADSTVTLETSQLKQEGAQGVDVSGARERIEDGEVTSQRKLGQWRAKDPQAKVISYGTLVEKKVLDVGGTKIEYWLALTMYATSYSPCRLGKPNYCHSGTAGGAVLQRGVVAMTRADYAVYGNSQVYIPGYGTATVADIGGGKPGKRWIDLGYGDDDYKAWSSDVTVYFLWPPPAGYLTTEP